MIAEHLHNYLELAEVFWPALLAAAALAIAGPIVGSLVILRRESLLALSIPQIVTLGAALALREGWPVLSTALAAVGVALLMLAAWRRRDIEHLLLPALYVGGVCVSILLVTNAGAELIEVQNLFSGIDIAVGEAQAIATGAVLLAAASVCAVLWRRWLLIAQAPAAAELAGLRPIQWDGLFLCLLVIVLVLGTSASGGVMVLTMLFLPAASSLPWARRIPNAMIGGIVAAFASLVAGFVLSTELNWPLSHSAGGAGVAIFLVSNLAAMALR
jgi:ABC-type Mn2+/Zn2+ transport system permease subunit